MFLKVSENMSDILDSLKSVFKALKGHIFLIIWGVLMFPFQIVAINLCKEFMPIDFLQSWVFPCCVYPLIHQLIGSLIVLFTVKDKKKKRDTLQALNKFAKYVLYVGWFLMFLLIAHEGIITSLLVSILMTNVIYVVVFGLVGFLTSIIGCLFFKDISITDFIMIDWIFGSK